MFRGVRRLESDKTSGESVVEENGTVQKKPKLVSNVIAVNVNESLLLLLLLLLLLPLHKNNAVVIRLEPSVIELLTRAHII